MGDPAQTKRRVDVFISSTVEDLRDCRQAARDAAIRVRLHPEMQEYFVASDSHPPLEECLQRVSQCEVLVVIVARRYGWVPRDQSAGPRKSITWLESERAAEEGKEVLAFVLDKEAEWPLELEEEYRTTEAIKKREATPELLAEVQANVDGLEEFKRWLGGRAIWNTFANRDQVGWKVESALREWLDRNQEHFELVEPPPAPRDDPRAYLDALREQTGWIELRGLQVGSGRANRFPIERLYIPLTTAAAEPEAAAGRPVQLEEALQHRKLVIVGDPGAGKTTFLRRMANQLAERVAGEPAAELPVLIRVAELWEHMKVCRERHGHDGPTTPEAPEWLLHYLAVQSKEMNWGLDSGFFRGKLERGEALVFLDGLDEAPGRVERESLARLLEKATQAYGRCRFVVTTRPPAYAGATVLAGFHTAQIEPLGDEAIRTFLEHWCTALFPESGPAAKKHLAGLIEALRGSPEIRRMARNPVMLTALAVVHWNDRRLPEQRADLYESIVTWLARAREHPGRERAERCLALLQRLALAMMDQPEGRRVRAPQGWAADALAPLFPGVPEDERKAKVLEFLGREEIDSGILVSRGSEIQFWHLTFQEYLAARAIAGLADTAQHALLLGEGRIYRPEWRETVLLLGGILARQGTDKVDGVISAVLGKLGEKPPLAEQARCAGLLGALVRDLRPLGFVPADWRFRETLNAVLEIFDAKKARAVDLKVRVEAAEALGQAGDPRLEKDNWVRIEAGKFRMGDHLAREVDLDAYDIGRYPVTVAEYRRFFEEDGYANARWWRAGGFAQQKEPRGWEEQLQYPNRPVRRVNWYEAAAYCAWKGVRLPTEAEWERAARGTEGRAYPWGNEEPDIQRANYRDTAIGHPTPVGMFPAGATPDRIDDLAGNVWEWVAARYGEYQRAPARNPKGPERGTQRVVRGGSFVVESRFLRAAYRVRLVPGDRDHSFGFRCAREVL